MLKSPVGWDVSQSIISVPHTHVLPSQSSGCEVVPSVCISINRDFCFFFFFFFSFKPPNVYTSLFDAHIICRAIVPRSIRNALVREECTRCLQDFKLLGQKDRDSVVVSWMSWLGMA